MNINKCKYQIRYKVESKQIYSGGGSYDQEGNQIKIGKWIELVEGFYCEKQVYYKGEYNMNGMKVGRWDIMFCKYRETKYQIMQILSSIKRNICIYLVLVDHMIQKEIRKSLDSGQNWLKSFIVKDQPIIKVNII
ncbi:unnamed protein product [Paramecium sonneborni]|uniref:Uncharacterized protein n=1 Tax=Paramecium sonneborni TaxID=65129 RepID=A0A8S1RL25_9CILI|nr:unnamed protein product [Paramecium sonneborni]CAD8128886.1 unnamed protein product [Paramecium sonneborni]